MNDNPHEEPSGYAADYDPREAQAANNWAMALHLSKFAGNVIPLGGYLVPLLIWQLKKERYPILDDHGREVMNWAISETLYLVLFFLLTFVLIGFPLLLALVAVGVIFPIVGAIRASDGRVWRYPGNIRLL